MVFTIRDLVRRARGDLSQEDFAKLLGKSQAVLSKYERGTTNPPAAVIERCLKICSSSRASNSISSDRLADRVRDELGGRQYQEVRETIETILDRLLDKKRAK